MYLQAQSGSPSLHTKTARLFSYCVDFQRHGNYTVLIAHTGSAVVLRQPVFAQILVRDTLGSGVGALVFGVVVALRNL